MLILFFLGVYCQNEIKCRNFNGTEETCISESYYSDISCGYCQETKLCIDFHPCDKEPKNSLDSCNSTWVINSKHLRGICASYYQDIAVIIIGILALSALCFPFTFFLILIFFVIFIGIFTFCKETISSTRKWAERRKPAFIPLKEENKLTYGSNEFY